MHREEEEDIPSLLSVPVTVASFVTLWRHSELGAPGAIPVPAAQELWGLGDSPSFCTLMPHLYIEVWFTLQSLGFMDLNI